MQLTIDRCGIVHAVYSDDFELSALGSLTIRRASFVEPDDSGRWWVDLSPVNGPRLGPFDLRGQALAKEVAWLTENWLNCTPLEPITNRNHERS